MRNFIISNFRFILILVIAFVITQYKLPYYIDSPGGIIDISSRIEYDGKKDNNGSLNMLYVTERVATIPSYLLSFIIPDWDLENISANQVTSNETVEDINLRNKVMLKNSVNNAMYVAYKSADKKIEVKNRHNMVIVSNGNNGLMVGDEIISCDGKIIDNVDYIKDKITRMNVGDKLSFTVIRNKKEVNVNSKIGEVGGKKALGVVMTTTYDYDIDPKIELDFKASEGGSSGGLMMSLCIYNAISGEDILKGRKIAGTGTIDIDGNVGEIAGIKYKIIGAYNNHMDVVLVPKENYDEAINVVKNRNYNMKVVSVSSFDDAINYLKK